MCARLPLRGPALTCGRADAAVDLGDGRQIIEHVIADVRDGRIVRHVDVEAWD